MRALLPLVVFLAFAFQTPVFADMTVVREVTNIIGKTKSIFTQVIYFTKTKMRTNEPSGKIIISDVASKTVTVLDPKQKTYIQETFDDVKKREAGLPSEVRKATLTVRETGEKNTIDEQPCEKLLFKTGPSEVETWITGKIVLDPAMIEFNSKFREMTKGLKTFELHGQMAATFEKRKAYPYLIVIESPIPFGKGTQRTESKIKKVSYEEVDASVFAVPKGYKKAPPPPFPAKKKKMLEQKSQVSSSAVGRVTILGQSKSKVDQILSGWGVRRSRRATALRDIYYYTKDVEIIVTFAGEKAVGVGVVDFVAPGYSPISASRFRELCAMIGEYPKEGDIKRDGTGIREFYVGEVD